MPIAGCLPVGSWGGEYRRIGTELAGITHLHFAGVLGHSGIGISYGSCSAAVAVNNSGAGFNDPYAISPHIRQQMAERNYNALANSTGFAAVMGNSRLYTGLDPDYNLHVRGTVQPPPTYLRNAVSAYEQHAEQTAILEALARGLQFWTYEGHCHIYVDLIPCVSCMRWLQRRGESWCVYYHYDGEQQTQKMTDFKKEFQHRYDDSRRMSSKTGRSW
jgi:deoxycytidylate deaminase